MVVREGERSQNISCDSRIVKAMLFEGAVRAVSAGWC